MSSDSSPSAASTGKAGGPQQPQALVDLRQLVSEIPDFPKPGILFRDLTPLMRDRDVWQEVIRRLAVQSEPLQPDLIVGIESRGFIVGMALSMAMGLGFVPIRKPGKLPGPLHRVDYELEYGSDRLEIQRHAFVTITPSASIIDEGRILTTTVSTTAIATGTTLYYEFSGKGIDAADFASGTLTGQETVGSDGSLRLSHAIANDGRSEGPEVLEIRIFADSDHRLQLGDTAYVTINDTSTTPCCTGKRVLVIDDLLATGGTAAAAGELVTLAGGNLCGFGFVIELAELGGRGKLPSGVPVESLIVYS